jgi:hypothetical protein
MLRSTKQQRQQRSKHHAGGLLSYCLCYLSSCLSGTAEQPGKMCSTNALKSAACKF